MAAKPTYIAFTVRNFEKDGQKQGRWLEIGAAWPNQDGDGFNIDLVALPVDGHIVLRKPKAKPEQGEPA